MPKTHAHSTFPAVVRRLRRAEGHLHSTIAMVESGRSCVDLAQQLHAIEKAISSAKKALINDHMDHCLQVQHDAGPAAAKVAMTQFREISKYL